MKFSAADFAKVVQALEAKAYSAASTDSAVIDVLGFDEALVILNAGVAAAAAEADVTIREGDESDGSDDAAIAGAAFAQITVANDQTVYVGRLDLSKRKRYFTIRNVGDGANAVTLGVTVVLMRAKYPPATQVETVAFDL